MNIVWRQPGGSRTVSTTTCEYPKSPLENDGADIWRSWKILAEWLLSLAAGNNFHPLLPHYHLLHFYILAQSWDFAYSSPLLSTKAEVFPHPHQVSDCVSSIRLISGFLKPKFRGQRNFNISRIVEIAVGPWKSWRRKDQKFSSTFNYGVGQTTHSQARQKHNELKKSVSF